jgi:Ca2+-transporting ATPase
MPKDQKAAQQIYSLSIEETLKKFGTTKKGLTDTQIKKLTEEFGPNKVTIEDKTPIWKKISEPFMDPLVLMLMGAGIISFFVGENETGIIFMIIIAINAGLDFWQSYQANNIMKSLKGFVKNTANVRRNGKIQEVHTESLVPGDIVLMDEGDTVPADLRLIKAVKLSVNSFALTGESVPQQKSAQGIEGDFSTADQTNIMHMGSTVVTGSGEAVVVATGMNSLFGNIPPLSSQENDDKTPLQAELGHMAKRNFLLAMAVMIIMFILSITVLDKPMLSTIIFCIVVATSMVPQGLPLEINLSLLLGVFRLGKRQAVVKKLAAVEALGSASVVCTDKTGTITRNEMNVQYAFGENFHMEISGTGYLPTGKISINKKPIELADHVTFHDFFNSVYFNNHARLCEPDREHPDYYVIGDPTEGALRVFGKRLGIDDQSFMTRFHEEDEVPFDSTRKMMSSLFYDTKQKNTVVYTKGAAESVLGCCTHYKDFKTGAIKKITTRKKGKILAEAEKFASEAYRVLAIAYKTTPKTKTYNDQETESGLTYLGCVVMMDLPRDGVAEAFAVASKAHIKTIMITGDNMLTALAIAKKTNLIPESEKNIFKATGAELAKMRDGSLKKKIKKSMACVFARISPEQKLRIVKLLKAEGEIVAVTGDGVNDAPALRQAHIGVSMGRIGTSVAKEASQIVLADDSYSTLIHAIKEGRTIYQNLVKTVKSCYTSNFGELFVILFGIFFAAQFNGHEPLVPIQILLIDLLGEMAPLICLTFDPLYKGAMERPPRNMKRNVLNKVSITDIIFTGLLMGVTSFSAFAVTYNMTDGDNVMASTAAYVMLLLAQYINILSRRHPGFIFNEYFWKNKYMWWSMGITLVIVFGMIHSPLGQIEAVSFKPIAWNVWPYLLLILVGCLTSIELKKVWINRWTKQVYGEV